MYTQAQSLRLMLDFNYFAMQCYLPPDTSKLAPPNHRQTGNRFTYPGWMEDSVDLDGWLQTEMAYQWQTVTPSK